MKLNLSPCVLRFFLAALAKEQNPVLGYYDPIGLADVDLWGQGTEASIGARDRCHSATAHSRTGIARVAAEAGRS